MKKASVTTNTNTNTNNIFDELISELSDVERDKRERASEISENKANGFSTLVKQANKNDKDGFSYVMHNANILSEQVLKALKCNSGERARVDKNKAKWILSKRASELEVIKIKVSSKLLSELSK